MGDMERAKEISERRRRITWWMHNIMMTPFIPVRVIFLIFIRLGEVLERVGLDYLPGWRRYDGWEGW